MRPFRAARALPSPSPLPQSEPGPVTRARRSAAAVLLLAGAFLALPPGPAHAQTAQEVPDGWALVPSGLSVGDSFRLLFVTSGSIQGNSSAIGDYNTFVQNQVNAGHMAIRGFSGEFRALASTSAVNGRTNTATRSTDTDAPIYWLNGAKVADNYADLYDGGWDSNVPRDRNGATFPGAVTVWTGTASDGTTSGALGGSTARLSDPKTQGQELDVTLADPGLAWRLYGLSPVITVSHTPGQVTGVQVDQVTHDSIRVRWTKPSESSSRPITSFGIHTRTRNAAGTGWIVNTDDDDDIPNTNPEGWVWRDNAGADATSRTLSGLPSDVLQEVRVFARAVQSGQTPETLYGADSDYVEFTTSADQPPALSTAAVNGAALTLTYNEALDTGSVPAAGAFTVTVGGMARTVSNVAVGSSAVTLTLASAVAAGQTVAVSYAVPTGMDAMPIQDAAGNDAAALTNQAVANATPGIVLSPTSLTVAEGGTGTYTVRLNTQPTGEVTVTVARTGSDEVAFDTSTASGAQTTLTFTTGNWGAAQTVTVSAASDADTANDGATLTHTAAGGGYGSLAADLTVTVTDAGDTTGPALSSASVNGATLTLAYSEPLDTNSVPAAGAFAVTVAGTARAVSNVAVAGSAVTLTLASAATAGQTVTVGYAVPTNGAIRDAAGNGAEALTGQAVANNTPGVVLTPTSLTVAEGGSGTYTVALAALPTGSVTVTVSSDNADVTVDADGNTDGGQNALTFTTGNWSAARTVTVSAGEDDDADDDGATLTHAITGAGEYDGLSDPTLAVTVNDNDAPARPRITRVGISSTPATGDTYAAGETISVTVDFDAELAVDTTGGTPWLPLRVGAFNVRAEYSDDSAPSGFGNGRLGFDYRVRTGDLDGDGVGLHDPGGLDVYAIELEGGTIRDKAGTVDANRQIPSGQVFTDDARHKVDTGTDIHSVAITSSPASDGTYRLGETVEVTVRVNSNAVTRAAGGPPRVALTFGSGARTQTRHAPYGGSGSADGARALYFRYAVAAGDSDDDGISIAADAVQLNGGQFTDGTNPVTLRLTHPAVAADMGQRVDAATATTPTTPTTPTTGEGEDEDTSQPPTGGGGGGTGSPPSTGGGGTAAVVRILHAEPVAEGSLARFRITLEAPAQRRLDLLASTAAGTASEGADYAGLTRHPVTVAPGESGLWLEVATHRDAEAEDGETFTVTLSVAVGSAPARVVRHQARGTILDGPPPAPAGVPLLPPASDMGRQGFVRLINHGDAAGEVAVEAIDDTGRSAGTVTVALPANGAAHFNSGDLEDGNPAKGIEAGVGPGQGNWRLVLTGDLAFSALAYVRTRDGFVTAMHDAAPADGDRRRIAFLNPASNWRQVSSLRLVNPGAERAQVTVAGVDDAGVAPAASVTLDVPAGGAALLTADELEAELGDGAGKWRLEAASDQPVAAMSLLSSPTGHLTNLSTIPVRPEDGRHLVPFLPPASDPHGRQGFVRVANRSGRDGTVAIQAFDDAGTDYGTLTLALDAGETAHFNTHDLEVGSPAKGLAGSTGPAVDGGWRLALESELALDVLAYVRHPDGFVTAMHDLAPEGREGPWVAFLNPASNWRQVSLLRLVNPGAEDATAILTGTDDAGASGRSPVYVTVPAGASRTLSATDLEAGAEGLRGAFGDGTGKWRVAVSSRVPVLAMSLLESPTGHLTNLSTAPQRGAR